MNERALKNLRNAANMILHGSDYPPELTNQIREAYEKNEYQRVLDLAAEHDIGSRETLDDKINIVANPNYDPRPVLFQIEGVEGNFDSASQAVAAYREQHSPDSVQRHKFAANHIPEEEREDPGDDVIENLES